MRTNLAGLKRTRPRDGTRVKFGSLIIICELWPGIFTLDTKRFVSDSLCSNLVVQHPSCQETQGLRCLWSVV